MIKRAFSHLPLTDYNLSRFETLTQKIKQLEKSFEIQLAQSSPYLIRLDGCCFKSFTKYFQKPFDPRLTDSLIKTTEYLVDKLGARIGFCQSDEISLVLKPDLPDPTLPHISRLLYNGRVQKITSIVASAASTKFNQVMRSHDWSGESPDVQEKVRGEGGYFDCRAFSVPDDQAAMEVIYWRHHYDCRRNAINSIGFHYFPHRQMQGLSVGQVLEKLAVERELNVAEHFPSANVYGTFAKKKTVPHLGSNPRTGEVVHTTRNRVESRSFDLVGSDEEMTKIILAPKWNDIESESVEGK